MGVIKYDLPILFSNLTQLTILKIVENNLESLNRILTGCFNREHKYQKMLYEKYYGFALKTVFRYIYRYDKAVDTVNDGFIKFFTKIEQFKRGTEDDTGKMLMCYIKRIMINTAIDELRRGKMMPEIGGIPDHVWDIPDNSENAEPIVPAHRVGRVRGMDLDYRRVGVLADDDAFSFALRATHPFVWH